MPSGAKNSTRQSESGMAKAQLLFRGIELAAHGPRADLRGLQLILHAAFNDNVDAWE